MECPPWSGGVLSEGYIVCCVVVISSTSATGIEGKAGIVMEWLTNDELGGRWRSADWD